MNKIWHQTQISWQKRWKCVWITIYAEITSNLDIIQSRNPTTTPILFLASWQQFHTHELSFASLCYCVRSIVLFKMVKKPFHNHLKSNSNCGCNKTLFLIFQYRCPLGLKSSRTPDVWVSFFGQVNAETSTASPSTQEDRAHYDVQHNAP